MAKGKKTGTRYERECKEYLQPVFPLVERTGSARVDQADLMNTDDFLIECKHVRDWRTNEWMTRTRLIANNLGRRYPMVIIKRRRFNVAGSYVMMELDTFRNLVAELKGIDLTPAVEADPRFSEAKPYKQPDLGGTKVDYRVKERAAYPTDRVGKKKWEE